MKIYGRNAVAEAIKSGNTIDRLVAAKGQKDVGAQRIIDDAKSRGIKVFFYDKEVLDRETGGKKHQGFVAEVTDFKYCELNDILAYAEQKGEAPFVFVLDGVEDPHNLGSILRVAECTGAHGVVIPRHRSVSVNDTVVKVSAGAAEHIRVAKVTNVNDAIDELKKRNVWVYAAEAGGKAYYDTDFSGPCAVIFGSESLGVSHLLMEKSDFQVSIPMYGHVNSLNVSTAASVILCHAAMQHHKK